MNRSGDGFGGIREWSVELFEEGDGVSRSVDLFLFSWGESLGGDENVGGWRTRAVTWMIQFSTLCTVQYGNHCCICTQHNNSGIQGDHVSNK